MVAATDTKVQRMRGGSSKTRIETDNRPLYTCSFISMRGGSSKTRIETDLESLKLYLAAESMRGGSSKTRIETKIK